MRAMFSSLTIIYNQIVVIWITFLNSQTQNPCHLYSLPQRLLSGCVYPPKQENLLFVVIARTRGKWSCARCVCVFCDYFLSWPEQWRPAHKQSHQAIYGFGASYIRALFFARAAHSPDPAAQVLYSHQLLGACFYGANFSNPEGSSHARCSLFRSHRDHNSSTRYRKI